MFTDLPANALGCFVVGFIASSKALDLQDGRNVAILPPQHWLQGAHALQTGLRTGFCGCLTTFASWCAACLLAVVDRTFACGMLQPCTHAWCTHSCK